MSCFTCPRLVTVVTGPPAGRTPKVKNVFWLKIDAKSITEALATTILILQKFSIDLAHPWGSRGIGPPHPSGTPHRHPWAPPEHPLSTPGHSRATFEYKNRGSSRDFFSRGEPRIMYSFALGQPGQSRQTSFRGEGNVTRMCSNTYIVPGRFAWCHRTFASEAVAASTIRLAPWRRGRP